MTATAAIQAAFTGPGPEDVLRVMVDLADRFHARDVVEHGLREAASDDADLARALTRGERPC